MSARSGKQNDLVIVVAIAIVVAVVDVGGAKPYANGTNLDVHMR